MRLRIALIAVFAIFLSPFSQLTSSAALKTCTGVQVAQVANYARQIYAIQGLRQLENIRLQKAQLDLESNTAVGNPTGIQLAKIDVQSAQGNINNYNSQINGIDQKKQAILKVCKFPEEGKAPGTSGTKLKKCTASVVVTLESLASQFRTKQNLKKLDYEYMMRSKIQVAQYQSLGQMSNAAKASLDYSKYQRSYQEDEIFAGLIKQEFDGLNSSCTGSGVSLPAVFVPPVEQTTTNTTPAAPACQSANCIPSAWSNSAQAVAGTNGQPSHVGTTYTSDLSTYCINRGTGSLPITNARIFMAFTATETWNKDYLSMPDESDFFKLQSDIGKSNLPLETVDLTKNWITFGSDTPKTAEVKKMSGITVSKLTTHLCDAKIPWQGNLRSKYSAKIKGVGFFYVGENGVDRPIVIYLNGFNADWFEEPTIDMKVENDENTLTYSGKAFSVSAYQNNPVTTGFPTYNSFGSVCFKIDGDAAKFECSRAYGTYPIQGTLSLASLSSGPHTLEIYIPGLAASKTTSFTYKFELKRASSNQLDDAAKVKIENLIAACNKNFLGDVPIKITATNGAAMSLESYSWGVFDWKQEFLARLKVGELGTLDLKYVSIPLKMNWVNTGSQKDVGGALVTTISTGTWGYNDTTSGRLGGVGWTHPIWMYDWQLGATRVWTIGVPITDCSKKAEYVDFHTQ
jgi:hypothetical protein